MTSPTRPKRTKLFDSQARTSFDESAEKLASALDALPARTVNPLVQSVPLSSPPGGSHLDAVQSESATDTEPAAAGARPVEPSPQRDTRPSAVQSPRATKSTGSSRPSYPKPPEVLLSQDVYLRLTQFSAQEKLEKRVRARPFGIIAMDALERHADELASHWAAKVPDAPTAGALFIRPAPKAGSRYRRHALPPKTVALQGICPENARLLDKLVTKWNTGSRSALVEQALRLEFEL